MACDPVEASPANAGVNEPGHEPDETRMMPEAAEGGRSARVGTNLDLKYSRVSPGRDNAAPVLQKME